MEDINSLDLKEMRQCEMGGQRDMPNRRDQSCPRGRGCRKKHMLFIQTGMKQIWNLGGTAIRPLTTGVVSRSFGSTGDSR